MQFYLLLKTQIVLLLFIFIVTLRGLVKIRRTDIPGPCFVGAVLICGRCTIVVCSKGAYSGDVHTRRKLVWHWFVVGGKVTSAAPWHLRGRFVQCFIHGIHWLEPLGRHKNDRPSSPVVVLAEAT
jgi:hypothetical protein